jgi:hypothetical protein
MRLKDRSRTPYGGGFIYEDPILEKTIPLSGKSANTFKTLVRAVEAWYQANKVDIPSNLRELIEDDICRRQPKGRCTYSSGLGDQLSKVIHTVAGAIDSVAGTQLENKARSCRRCGQRRVKLNSR